MKFTYVLWIGSAYLACQFGYLGATKAHGYYVGSAVAGAVFLGLVITDWIKQKKEEASQK